MKTAIDIGIKETTGVPKAGKMIELLVTGQEAVLRTARSVFPLVDKVNDEPTADLFQFHFRSYIISM